MSEIQCMLWVLIILGFVCLGCLKSWGWLVAVSFLFMAVFQFFFASFTCITNMASYVAHFAMKPRVDGSRYQRSLKEAMSGDG